MYVNVFVCVSALNAQQYWTNPAVSEKTSILNSPSITADMDGRIISQTPSDKHLKTNLIHAFLLNLIFVFNSDFILNLIIFIPNPQPNLIIIFIPRLIHYFVLR